MDTDKKIKSGPYKILVVDDNVDAAFTLQMLLKIKGHHAHISHSGEQAIADAAALKPDVILMDISMPGMNGYDACRHIRASPEGRQTVIVALTGFGKEEDRRLSHEAGFDAHLLKPVDIKTLLDTLQNLLAA